MNLPNTANPLTAGFPLVIPTQSQQPTARLILRSNGGQVVQQWLVKQNKCTLGSASSCSLRCELAGIAPYHALLVIGARQIFIRALAPKLTRDGRSFNEILLTDEDSHFEIAGHRFELSRQGETLRSAAKAEGSQPARLKFTLARPFELSSRKTVASTIVAQSPRTAELTPVSSSNSDSKWVAQLIQSALEPLECQLHNLIEPLTELQNESRKQRRLRKKRRLSKAENSQSPSPSAEAIELAAAAIVPKVSHQVEELAVKHAAAMAVLTERICDVNQQLATIESIVANERDASQSSRVSADEAKLAIDNLPIEQLQSGISAITIAIEDLQTQAAQENGQTRKWRFASDEQLIGLTEIVNTLSARVSEVHKLAASESTREHEAQEQVEEQQWKSEVKQHLIGLSQLVSDMSASVTEVQRSTLSDIAQGQKVATPGVDQQWQQNTQEQLLGLTQVIDGLSAKVAEVHTTTANNVLQQASVAQNNDDLEWKSTVQEQMNGLRQVIEGLSQTVAEVHQLALSGIKIDSGSTIAAVPNRDDEFSALASIADDSETMSHAPRAFAVEEPIQETLAEPFTEAFQELFEEPTSIDAPWEALKNPPINDADRFEFQSVIPEQVDDYEEPAADHYLVEEFPEPVDELPVDELPVDVLPVDESAVDESAVDESSHSLPSWWREDDDEQAALSTSQIEPETEDDAQQLVLDSAESESRAEDDYQSHAFDEPEPVAMRNEESEEFFGLAQLRSDELPQSESEPVAIWSEEPKEFFELAELSPDEPPRSEPESGEIRKEESEEFFGLAQLSSDEPPRSEPEPGEIRNEESEEFFGLGELSPEELVSIEDVLIASPEAPSEVADAVVGEEDGDSVEDYMRKLLARMRGVPEEEIELNKPALAPVSAPVRAAPKVDPETAPAQIPARPTSTSGPRTTVFAQQTEVDSLEVTEPFDPEKYMPRALAPDRNKSLAAMRELANSSARSAIHKSTRQRHVASILLKGVIAVIGLLVGGILVAINGLNLNIGLVATVASFLVAAIWGYDSLTSIRPMLKAGLVLRPQTNNARNQVKEEVD